jgi:hypothetical protein
MVSGLRLSARRSLSTSNRFTSLRVWVLSFFFKSSLQPKDTGCGPSILVGTRKASDEISSPKILTEEGFGSGSVVGSVLGLPEVGFEMFLKGSPIG